MDLDNLLRADLLLNQKVMNCLSLVTCQLQDGTPMVVVDHSAVAAACLLEVLRNLLHVQVLRQALHNCKTFPALPLLGPDVDVRRGRTIGTYPRLNLLGRIEGWLIDAFKVVSLLLRQWKMTVQPEFSPQIDDEQYFNSLFNFF